MVNSFLIKSYSLLKTVLARNLNINPGAPAVVILDISNQCNLKCQFCSRWTQSKFKAEPLSLDVIFRLIDEAAKNGTLMFHLYGGEPLLNKDIFRIISCIRKNKMRASMISNGTLLSESNITKLKQAGLNSLFVSLDSHKAKIHDILRRKPKTFEKAYSSLKKVRKIFGHKINLGLNVLITKKNYQNLTEFIDLAKMLDLDMIRITPMHNLPFFRKSTKINEKLIIQPSDIHKLSEEIKLFKHRLNKENILGNSNFYLDGITDFVSKRTRKVKCYAGYFFCDISYNGDLYVCDAINKPVGNIKKNGFMNTWNSKRCHRIRQLVQKNNCDCWQSCYIDMSLKASPIYLISNVNKHIREIGNYLFK